MCGQKIKLLLHYCHLKQTRHRKHMLARKALERFVTAWTCRIGTWIPAIDCRGLRSINFLRLLARLYTSSGSRAWRPISPQHHLQVTIVSTTKDQALSGVRHGCRDSVGRPTGSAGGKRDFLASLACPKIHCGATTGSVDPPRAYKSCGRNSNTIASIDGSKDGRTGLSVATTLGVDTDVVSSTRDACKS